MIICRHFLLQPPQSTKTSLSVSLKDQLSFLAIWYEKPLESMMYHLVRLLCLTIGAVGSVVDTKPPTGSKERQDGGDEANERQRDQNVHLRGRLQ